MTINQIGQKLRIQVSPKMIEKSTRFFNATIKDILNELLQNSRRAGASKIDISLIENGMLSLTDDGVGMFRNGVSLLLGESGWDKTTTDSEDPAGMGIFSLSNRGAVIESMSLRVQLQPAHFCGQQDVLVENSCVTQGTRISFSLSRKEVKGLVEVIENCAKFYPIPVYIDGRKVKRKNFLEGAVYRRLWNGLEIGVFDYRPCNDINFYGLVINQELPTVGMINANSLKIAVDVIDAPELKLVLPARKEVVQNKFFQELQEEAYRVIYSYISTLEKHRLPYDNWVHAASLGITLPEAEQTLTLYQPQKADSNSEDFPERVQVKDNSLLFAADTQVAEEQIFWHGFSGTALNYELMSVESGYQGYSWYDSLPVLTEIQIFIESGSKTVSLENATAQIDTQRPDAICIEGNIKHSCGQSKSIRFGSAVAFWMHEEAYSDLDELNVYVPKNSDLGVDELAELFEDAYFYPSDDCESDSWETQRERFAEQAYALATEILLSSEEALQERVRIIVNRELRWLVPKGQSMTIAIRGTDISVTSFTDS